MLPSALFKKTDWTQPALLYKRGKRVSKISQRELNIIIC